MLAVDVAVIGAGPAGAAAAITARRAGRRVALIDKAGFPRDKTCGDGLTSGALRLLEDLGLDPASVPSWHRVDDVVITSPSGRTVSYPLPRTDGQFAAVAQRRDLDAALVAVAVDHGAELLEHHEVISLATTADDVVVGTDAGAQIRARFVVAADGMWSPTRKLAGIAPGRYLGDWHAIRQYFTGVDPAHRHRLHVWFEPDVLPGYVWSFPLPDGGANVGYGLVRDTATSTAEMGRRWNEIVERGHIAAALGPDAAPASPARAWPIPARADQTVLSLGRTLFAGDAAALTDPMTGEGIAQALWSGSAAATAACSGAPPAQVRRRYETDVRRELLADHRFARRLGRVLASQWGARAAVRVSGTTPWVREQFVRWLFEDYPRAALATPSRWDRRWLHQPGAWAPVPR